MINKGKLKNVIFYLKNSLIFLEGNCVTYCFDLRKTCVNNRCTIRVLMIERKNRKKDLY